MTHDEYDPRLVAREAKARATERNGRQSPPEQHAETRRGDASEAVTPTDLMSAPAPALERSCPEPPAPEAFHGLAGEIARFIEPESEADPVALLVQILVAVGNVVGRTACFLVEGTYHYLNEFVALVGDTSKARKGTSWGRISALMHAVESVWSESRILSGLSSGEGVIWNCRDARRREKNGELVEEDAGESDKRLLVVESEYATVLRQLERTANTLSVTLRQAWDGTTLRNLTSGRQQAPIQATAAHISIIGHITAEELRRYMSSTEAASGYGNRYLHLCVKRSKCLPRGGRPLDLSGFAAKLREVVGRARQIGELTWDAEAGAIWDAVYPELSEGKPGLCGALIARGEAHVLRLACIYAVMDLAGTIRPEHLKAALALWEFCERSVKCIWGDSLGDPVADEILRALRNVPMGLSRTDISNLLGRHESRQRIGQALRLLVKHDLARADSRSTDGRPEERWFAAGLKR